MPRFLRITLTLWIVLAASPSYAQDWVTSLPYGVGDLIEAEERVASGKFEEALPIYERAYESSATMVSPLRFETITVNNKVLRVPALAQERTPKARVALSVSVAAVNHDRPDVALDYWNRLSPDADFGRTTPFGDLNVPTTPLSPDQEWYLKAFFEALGDEAQSVSHHFRFIEFVQFERQLSTSYRVHLERRADRTMFASAVLFSSLFVVVMCWIWLNPGWPTRRTYFADFAPSKMFKPAKNRRPWIGIMIAAVSPIALVPFVVFSISGNKSINDAAYAVFLLTVGVVTLIYGWRVWSNRMSHGSRATTPVGMPESAMTAWTILNLADERGFETSARFGIPVRPFLDPDPDKWVPSSGWSTMYGLGYATWLSAATRKHGAEIPRAFDDIVLAALRTNPIGIRGLVRKYLFSLSEERRERFRGRLPHSVDAFLFRTSSGDAQISHRLEALDLSFRMVTGLGWDWDEWAHLFICNGPDWIHGLLWRGDGQTLFRVADDGDLLDVSGEVVVEQFESVELVHSVFLSDEEVAGWTQHFVDFEIVAEVPQLDRIVSLEPTIDVGVLEDNARMGLCVTTERLLGDVAIWLTQNIDNKWTINFENEFLGWVDGDRFRKVLICETQRYVTFEEESAIFDIEETAQNLVHKIWG